MTVPWEIRVYEKQQLLHSEEVDGDLELGRQQEERGEPGPFSRQEGDVHRLVIASGTERDISRRHVLVEPLADGKFRLNNVSSNLKVGLADGTELRPSASCELPLPVVFRLGRKTLRIQEPEADSVSGHLQSLAEASLAPGNAPGTVPPFASLPLAAAASGVATDRVVLWLKAAMDVLQSAANSSDFYSRAERAAVDLVPLDSARVLLYEKGEWRPPQGTAGAEWAPSRRILDRLLREKKTFWLVPAPQSSGASLLGVKAVVAAPILSRDSEVIGALYGDRRTVSVGALSRPITEPEARLVELLAGGIAAGLARVEQEKAAAQLKVQYEQFFPPELARVLIARPELLQGRDAEVTILFCDIRSFSRISAHLEPTVTVDWIRHVMQLLSECVLEHQGVVVNYIGDELMAMWGAPQEQADQGRLACRAALDMLARLPELNARWQPVLGEPMALGAGVNTGKARVGDIGTKAKFVYGPLGNTVNLASRVQGATKHLKTRLLITEATRRGLDAEFAVRRLCEVRVVNIPDPVALYELVSHGQPDWDALRQGYEEALGHFEKKEFREAARVLGGLLPQHPNDGPSLILMHRAVQCLVEEPEQFSPVWELPGK